MNSLSIEFICGMTAGILAGDVETHAANDSTGIYSYPRARRAAHLDL